MCLPDTSYQNFVIVNGFKVFVPPGFPANQRNDYGIAKDYYRGYDLRLKRIDALKRLRAAEHISRDVFPSLREQDADNWPDHVVIDRRREQQSSFGIALPPSARVEVVRRLLPLSA